MKTATMIVLLIIVPAFCHSQATWYVPDDYPTIQGAIANARVVNGDTIIVKPGTYVENIDLLGKAITVKSLLGPATCILDGGKIGSVVTINKGEGTSSSLEGFTIKNGSGINYYNSANDKWIARGCGIYMEGTGTKIANCDFTDFSYDTSLDGAEGMAVLWLYSPSGCYPRIEDCRFYDIVPTEISDWRATIVDFGRNNDNLDGDKIIFRNNEMFNNIGISSGFITDQHTDIENCTFHGNTARWCAPFVTGGSYTDSIVVFSNNLFYDNTNNDDYYVGSLHIVGAGGALQACSVQGEIHVINNTFYGNEAFYAGGADYIIGLFGTVTFINNIVWNNETVWISGDGSEIYAETVLGSVEVKYCDIEGGETAITVDGPVHISDILDSNPQFVDTSNDDFHLTWLSPCINRGTSEGAPIEDTDGDPRPYMGSVDMGADEFVGIHPLEADVFVVYGITGGKIEFTLTGRLNNSGRNYIIVGGITGTIPGIPLPGGLETLRLNWDAVTDFILAWINTPVFWNFSGTLDASGTAFAQLNAPPVPGLVGTTMYYAFALNNPWDFVSNPVAVEIVP